MSYLLERERKYYGPPSTLKAHEPTSDIRASFGPALRDSKRKFFVRGVQVWRTFATKGQYVLCQFADGRAMYVNEKNVMERA